MDRVYKIELVLLKDENVQVPKEEIETRTWFDEDDGRCSRETKVMVPKWEHHWYFEIRVSSAKIADFTFPTGNKFKGVHKYDDKRFIDLNSLDFKREAEFDIQEEDLNRFGFTKNLMKLENDYVIADWLPHNYVIRYFLRKDDKSYIVHNDGSVYQPCYAQNDDYDDLIESCLNG